MGAGRGKGREGKPARRKAPGEGARVANPQETQRPRAPLVSGQGQQRVRQVPAGAAGEARALGQPGREAPGTGQRGGAAARAELPLSPCPGLQGLGQTVRAQSCCGAGDVPQQQHTAVAGAIRENPSVWNAAPHHNTQPRQWNKRLNALIPLRFL